MAGVGVTYAMSFDLLSYHRLAPSAALLLGAI